MKNRNIVYALVSLMVVLMTMGSLFAQETIEEPKASVFDVGLVLNYSYDDLAERDFEEVIPGVQVQWNFLPWMGLSAMGYYRGEEYVTVAFEAVVRAPSGIIQPYIATGPGYLLLFNDEDTIVGMSRFAYNLRMGLDVTITDYLSIGPGYTLLIPDVEYFVDNLSALDSDYFASNSLMSINLKLRL